MGARDGSIIATIITTHMPRNDTAAPGQVWPGIRIQAIDRVQPPGIVIPPIADMDVQQTIVTAALPAKSSAEAPKNARSAHVVLVMAAPPQSGLVASQGCAVEPLVHAPQAVQPARVGRIRVIDDAVVEDERAHAGPLAKERRPVGADTGGDRGADAAAAGRRHRPLVLGREVVRPDARPLLLLRDPHLEVVVELAPERGRPREAP